MTAVVIVLIVVIGLGLYLGARWVSKKWDLEDFIQERKDHEGGRD